MWSASIDAAVHRQGVAASPPHHVPPGRALRPVGLERAAQPHHVGLQRLARRGRRVAVPERLGEGVRAHDARRTGGQRRQEQPLLRARHGDGGGVVRQDLQRSEDRDPHARR